MVTRFHRFSLSVITLAAFVVSALPATAAESRLARAEQRRVRPEGAATNQPRATPWVSERNDDKP